MLTRGFSECIVTPDMDKVLTPEEVAKKIGLSVPQVRLLIRQGRIKAKRFGSRGYIVAAEDAVKPELKKRGRPPLKKGRRAK